MLGLFFGDGGQVDVGDVELFKDFDADVELSFAAVDDDEVGEVIFIFGAEEAAREHLVQGSIVVSFVDVFDFEEAGPLFVVEAVGEGDHGGDEVAAGDVGGVEALDAAGIAVEFEGFLEVEEHFFAAAPDSSFSCSKSRFGVSCGEVGRGLFYSPFRGVSSWIFLLCVS